MYFEGITGFGAYSRILCLRIYRTNCCSGQVVNVAGLVICLLIFCRERQLNNLDWTGLVKYMGAFDRVHRQKS